MREGRKRGGKDRGQTLRRVGGGWREEEQRGQETWTCAQGVEKPQEPSLFHRRQVSSGKTTVVQWLQMKPPRVYLEHMVGGALVHQIGRTFNTKDGSISF